MGEIILLIIMLYWLAADTTTALWVLGGLFVLFVIGTLAGGGKKEKPRHASAAGRPRIRIDHPHVITDDQYECTVCGRRFSANVMACPYCGVRFTGVREDYEEFDWEEDELEAWEEEEGR